jgi:septum formation protein
MRHLDTVILASVSPRRSELLKSLGLHVLIVPSNVDETDPPALAPAELASFHADAKAEAVAGREHGHVIVAADTVVDLDGRALGKPSDATEARWMLESLAGREHTVHSAFTLIDAANGARLSRLSSTRVRFYPLPGEEIERYLATGESFDKAGAYGIQGRGATLVERIDGDFYTVMGFPLGLFVRSLPELGYRLAPSEAAAR